MIKFAENLNKMIAAGLGGALEAPRTEVAVGHRIRYLELSGTVESFETNIVAPIRSLRVDMLPIQAGSGDPSPDNIRPITGRDSVTVTRTGGNLWGGEALKDDVLAKVTGATADTTNKTVSYSASNVSSVLLLNGVFFKPSTQYTLIFKGDNTSATVKYLNLQVNYTDGTHYNNINFTDGVCVFTSPAGKTIQSIQGVWGTGTTTLYYDESGIFEGALTAADFIPYDGASVTIQLGQTVYGGTLDVTTGTMEVEWANIASYDGETLPGEWISDRDVYAEGTTPATGAQVCYKLAEPLIVQLSPQTIATLLGQNNVWSDAGNISLEYPYYEETEGY